MTSTRRKPLPAHGTRARAGGSPHSGIPRCPCEPCRRAEYRYDVRRRHLAATNRKLTVDPTPAADHLRQLRADGMPVSAIIKAAKISRATVRQLVLGRPAPIRRTTASAILAIPARSAAGTAITVPSIGSTRRLRALVAIGHSGTRIRQATGLTHTTIWQVTAGRSPVVLASTADTIAGAYRLLVASPGASVRERNRAARNGWAGPLQWGRDIDDPDAEPQVGEMQAAMGRREARSVLAASRADEIEHLASFGIPAADIAGRVGLSVDYVRDQLAGTRKPGWRNEQVSA